MFLSPCSSSLVVSCSSMFVSVGLEELWVRQYASVGLAAGRQSLRLSALLRHSTRARTTASVWPRDKHRQGRGGVCDPPVHSCGRPCAGQHARVVGEARRGGARQQGRVRSASWPGSECTIIAPSDWQLHSCLIPPPAVAFLRPWRSTAWANDTCPSNDTKTRALPQVRSRHTATFECCHAPDRPGARAGVFSCRQRASAATRLRQRTHVRPGDKPVGG
jgi:hypothetical protein